MTTPAPDTRSPARRIRDEQIANEPPLPVPDIRPGTVPAPLWPARPTPIQQGLPPSFKREGVVYAITFDMGIAELRLHYGDPYDNAYDEIRRVLESHGFRWQQGSTYFGGPAVTAITCVVAAQDLARSLPWFAASVCDIRMLRIEELNDLLPVIHRIAGLSGSE